MTLLPIAALCCFFCFLFLTEGRASDPLQEGRGQPSPSSAQIKEALRQVFKIPEEDTRVSKMTTGRPLRFMMKMYKKLSEGESKLPSQANTIKSLMPMEGSASSSSEDHFLLYNLTSTHDERLLTSYLHLMGHRRPPNRASRLLFYLDGGEGGHRDGNPVMVAFMKELPLDVDITRLTHKAMDSKPSLLLRLEEEQLRRGQWVKSSSKRLLRRTPLLITVSSDAQLLDIEAFGVETLSLPRRDRARTPVSLYDDVMARSRDSHEDVSEAEGQSTRPRRSISSPEDPKGEKDSSRTENSLPEFNILPEQDIARVFNTLSEQDIARGKYWSQKKASPSSVGSRVRSDYYVKQAQRAEMKKERLLSYENLPPMASNTFSEVSFNSLVDQEKNKTVDGGKEVARKEEERENQIQDYKSNVSSQRGRKEKSRKKMKPDYDDPKLLRPLKEFRPLPKSERAPRRKQRQGDGGLIPFPEYSVSWDKWEKPRGAKWRRRFRRGKKKNKARRAKAKHIPDAWLQVRANHRSNDATHPSLPSSLSSTGVCDRHEFFVDFRSLGWGKFIVAPKGFGTYFCAGVCPSPLSLAEAGTNHAIVQSLLRASKYPSKLPSACCVPSKLDSLTLLMVEEDGKLALRTLSNMVVKSCSCQ